MIDIDNLYPLILEPILIEKEWGQINFNANNDMIANSLVGLVKLLSADNFYDCKINNGSEHSKSLMQLVNIWSSFLVGDAWAEKIKDYLPINIEIFQSSQITPIYLTQAESIFYVLSAEKNTYLNAGILEKEINIDNYKLKNYKIETGDCFWADVGLPYYIDFAANILCLNRGLASGILCNRNYKKKFIAEEFFANNDQIKNDALLVHKLPQTLNSENTSLFADKNISIKLIKSNCFTEEADKNALNVILPLTGQGRIRTSGSSLATRILPGKAVLLPAYLGLYAIESNSFLSFLHILIYN